jgi:hypothetical protein
MKNRATTKVARLDLASRAPLLVVARGLAERCLRLIATGGA